MTQNDETFLFPIVNRIEWEQRLWTKNRVHSKAETFYFIFSIIFLLVVTIFVLSARWYDMNALSINRRKSWLTTIIGIILLVTWTHFDPWWFVPIAGHMYLLCTETRYVSRVEMPRGFRSNRKNEYFTRWVMRREYLIFSRPRDANWNDRTICFKNWSFFAGHRHPGEGLYDEWCIPWWNTWNFRITRSQLFNVSNVESWERKVR